MKPTNYARDPESILYGKVPLLITAALAMHSHLTFNELKERLTLTDGNLSIHARRLEHSGIVDCVKVFDGRIPRTTFSLTNLGAQTLNTHLNQMEDIRQHVARTREERKVTK